MAEPSPPQFVARLVDALASDLPAEIGPAATDAIKKHMLKKAPKVLAELFPEGIPSAEAFGEAVVSAVHPPPPLHPLSGEEDNQAMSDAAALQLDAKFEALRADMRLDREAARADRSEQKAEFEKLRADMSSFETRLIERVGAVEKAISGTEGHLVGLRDSIDGIKSATNGTQWIVGILLAVIAIWIAFEQWRGAAPVPLQAQTSATTAPPIVINNIIPPSLPASGPR